MKEIDAAIEALDVGWSPHYTGKDARALAEAALAGLRSLKEREPVAWVDTDQGVIVGTPRFFSDGSHGEVALYTHPAPEAKQEPVASMRWDVKNVELQEWPPFHECWAVRAVYFDKFGEPTMHKQVPERREQEKRISELEAQNAQLLEALKGLLWYVEQLETVVYDPSETDDHEVVAKARAAIAAAEGKT